MSVLKTRDAVYIFKPITHLQGCETALFSPQTDYSSCLEGLLYVCTIERDDTRAWREKKIWPIKQKPLVQTVKPCQYYSCRSPTQMTETPNAEISGVGGAVT